MKVLRTRMCACMFCSISREDPRHVIWYVRFYGMSYVLSYVICFIICLMLYRMSYVLSYVICFTVFHMFYHIVCPILYRLSCSMMSYVILYVICCVIFKGLSLGIFIVSRCIRSKMCVRRRYGQRFSDSKILSQCSESV